MKRWYDEERGIKMCEPDCVDECLFDIWAIGCDYDGCHTAKDLKKLIDELVGMANKARECLWERRLFGDHGEHKPQTNAEVVREWIPVTERLPDLELVEAMSNDTDFYPCLAVIKHERLMGRRYISKLWYDKNGFIDGDCIDRTSSVTHWMPLPEPPMRKGENG